MPERKNGFPWPEKTPPQKPLNPEGPPVSNPPGRPDPDTQPPTDFPDEA